MLQYNWPPAGLGEEIPEKCLGRGCYVRLGLLFKDCHNLLIFLQGFWVSNLKIVAWFATTETIETSGFGFDPTSQPLPRPPINTVRFDNNRNNNNNNNFFLYLRDLTRRSSFQTDLLVSILAATLTSNVPKSWAVQIIFLYLISVNRVQLFWSLTKTQKSKFNPACFVKLNLINNKGFIYVAMVRSSFFEHSS